MPREESHTAGRTTELTLVIPFKKGGPEKSPGIRYADRCRIILEAFGDFEKEGFVTPVRRFAGIHFARWTLIDADTRLLFTSNYDGTLDDYLTDFSEQIPWTLGLIWSNCEGYPEDIEGPGGRAATPGAADYPLFSKFVQHYQTAAGLFYGHTGHLTVRDLRYLQIFHQKVLDRFEQGGTIENLGELQRATMEENALLEAALKEPTQTPFPKNDRSDNARWAGSTPTYRMSLTNREKERYWQRMSPALKRLYGYEPPTMDAIRQEFGLTVKES